MTTTATATIIPITMASEEEGSLVAAFVGPVVGASVGLGVVVPSSVFRINSHQIRNPAPATTTKPSSIFIMDMDDPEAAGAAGAAGMAMVEPEDRLEDRLEDLVFAGDILGDFAGLEDLEDLEVFGFAIFRHSCAKESFFRRVQEKKIDSSRREDGGKAETRSRRGKTERGRLGR